MIDISPGRLLPFCLGTVLLLAPSAPAAVLTATEVLTRIRERQSIIETSSLKALWREFRDGRPADIEKEEIQWDKFGRIRVRYQYGPAGSALRSADELYDGELTVSAIEDPTLNRIRGPQTTATRKANERYRAVMIHDGLFPPGAGPRSHRNPLTFIEEPVSGSLNRLLGAGADVKVIARDGPPKVVELRFQEAPKDDPSHLQHVVLVDPAKGWCVISHDEFFPDDRSLASRSTCEYQADKHGVWLPTKGRWQAWAKRGMKGPPSFDWQYEVEQVAVNEPDFDEEAFKVSLQPGAYVTDIRFDVSYWVGQEGVIGIELTRLAQEAVAKVRAEEKRLKLEPGSLFQGASFRQRRFLYLIGANLLIAVAFVYIIYRRARRPEP